MTTAPRALFVDTGPLYAYFDADAPRHETAGPLIDALATDDCRYHPVFTTTYVIDELATLTLSRKDHATALEAVERVRGSNLIEIIHPTEQDFAATCSEFARFDDAGLSFTDHMIGVLATDRNADHVLTFDGDHFRTLGFTVVPGDTGDP